MEIEIVFDGDTSEKTKFIVVNIYDSRISINSLMRIDKLYFLKMFKSQLVNAIDSDPVSKFCFQGCFASDEIPKIQKKKFIILNTDPSEKQGEHWTVLFRENEDFYEFFNSLGQPG